MAEKRPRRRSLRRSEAEAVPPEEPPKKKSKRQSTTLERSKPGKPRNGRASGSLRVKNSASQSPGITESSKQRKKLLVSLNIQDHDLQVSCLDVGSKAVSRGKGRKRSRQPPQQGQAEETGGDGGRGSGGGVSGRTFKFKNPNFTFSSVGSNKKKVWKNLKQILAAEKASGASPYVSYGNIDAPPSFKPARKYSDLSGFIAKYTDPLTGLYYSSTDEFQTIRTLPQDIIQGYLALRGKLTIT